jgi:hypothetical protein
LASGVGGTDSKRIGPRRCVCRRAGRFVMRFVIGTGLATRNVVDFQRDRALTMYITGKYLELHVTQACRTNLPSYFRAKVPARLRRRVRSWHAESFRMRPFPPLPELKPAFEPAAVFEKGSVFMALVALTPAGLGTLARGGEDGSDSGH